MQSSSSGSFTYLTFTKQGYRGSSPRALGPQDHHAQMRRQGDDTEGAVRLANKLSSVLLRIGTQVNRRSGVFVPLESENDLKHVVDVHEFIDLVTRWRLRGLIRMHVHHGNVCRVEDLDALLVVLRR